MTFLQQDWVHSSPTSRLVGRPAASRSGTRRLRTGARPDAHRSPGRAALPPVRPPRTCRRTPAASASGSRSRQGQRRAADRTPPLAGRGVFPAPPRRGHRELTPIPAGFQYAAAPEEDPWRGASERPGSRSPVEGPFDAVVIGSGIGGLGAAAMLARRRGMRVLVLERHYTAGGFTHTFERDGFEWDVGVHYVGKMTGRRGALRRLFDYVTNGELRLGAAARGLRPHRGRATGSSTSRPARSGSSTGSPRPSPPSGRGSRATWPR